MKILLVSTSFNSFTQRVFTDLISAGHDVSVELAYSPDAMREAVKLFMPDLILCPFLKQVVPEDIWKNYLTIIMHPGILGDRGPSSIDWAMMENSSEWGVTALEADAEMDAGAIWSSHTCKLPLATKSYVYRTHIIEAGMKGIFELLAKLDGLRKGMEEIFTSDIGRAASDRLGGLKETIARAEQRLPPKYTDLLPQDLNSNDPKFLGRPRPLMTQSDRTIDWATDATESIVRKIHAADGFPGARDQIGETDYLLFGAHFEDVLGRNGAASPGDVVATRHGAICRKTVDAAVWITHLKRKAAGHKTFKLPATTVLPAEALAGVPESPIPTLFAEEYRTFKEIWYKEKNAVGYLFFEFHNGAMSTQQCRRLEAAIHEARKRPTKVLVFMGGGNFWSNGIHLNVIEAAPDTAVESWTNINAIDDVVLAVLTTCDRLTIAAVGANAGAGGAMMPLACDRIIARDGVVLNPHYQTMGLHGSEYWTYTLPRRVGQTTALALTRACLPVNAKTAAEIGMIDGVLSCDSDAFESLVTAYAERVAQSEFYAELLVTKQVQRRRDEAKKPLSLYRHEELSEMRKNFWGEDDAYSLARHNFVHKISCGKTPPQLARHRRQAPDATPYIFSSAAATQLHGG